MFSKVGDTALVLLVPEAEPLVHDWRSAHDPSAAEGMPAHITVLYPFVLEHSITQETYQTIAKICNDTPPLTVNFETVGRFPSVLWLDPGSPECRQLITAVRQAWPECLPYGQKNLDVIPHLTVTDGADESIALQAARAVMQGLPLRVSIPAVSLMIFDGTEWRCRQQFEFTRQVIATEPGLDQTWRINLESII